MKIIGYKYGSKDASKIVFNSEQIQRVRAARAGDDPLFLQVSLLPRENEWLNVPTAENRAAFTSGILPDPESLPTPKPPPLIYGRWENVHAPAATAGGEAS